MNCLKCEEDGTDTLATEERHGDPLCSNCAQHQDEAAYERMLDSFYGGSSPTAKERFEMDAMNKVRR